MIKTHSNIDTTKHSTFAEISRNTYDPSEFRGSHITFSNTKVTKSLGTGSSTVGRFNNLSKNDIKLLKRISDSDEYENAIKGIVDISKSKDESKMTKKRHFILFQDKFIYYKVKIGSSAFLKITKNK